MIETNKHTNGSSRSEKNDNTLIFVTTAMMTAMVMIATTFFKIPNAMGYVHLGDGFVLLAAIILPKKYACFAGGVGAGLADIYGGYAVWAPWTLAIKIVMVLIVQFFFDFIMKRASNGSHTAKLVGIPFAEFFAYVLAVLWTVSGYYVAQGFISGNWAAPIADVPVISCRHPWVQSLQSWYPLLSAKPLSEEAFTTGGLLSKSLQKVKL